MSVVDVFSKRQKRAKGEVSDVYQYDELPQPLRVQIINIMKSARLKSGECVRFLSISDVLNQISRQVIYDICHEHGMISLGTKKSSDFETVQHFVLNEQSIDLVLDVIDLFFGVIYDGFDAFPLTLKKFFCLFEKDDQINELNYRFREHGVGYQFESGKIIRIDSNFLHSEAIKPVLILMAEESFDGADQEFRVAHEHYRHGRHKECMVSALNAFESTMKTICERKEWSFDPKKSTSKNLISICLKEGLIPDYLQSQFSGVQQVLESGVPTMRNKNAGHGQGSTPVQVPDYFARYVLNLTATSILFLLEAYRAKQ